MKKEEKRITQLFLILTIALFTFFLLPISNYFVEAGEWSEGACYNTGPPPSGIVWSECTCGDIQCLGKKVQRCENYPNPNPGQMDISYWVTKETCGAQEVCTDKGLAAVTLYCACDCPSGETCSFDGNTCCTSHHYYQCSGGHVYWFNSCNIREGIKQSCTAGCSGSSCTAAPSGPSAPAGGVCTGTDECGYTGQTECAPGGTRYWSQIRTCGDWDGDGCLEWGDYDYCLGSKYSDWYCYPGNTECEYVPPTCSFRSPHWKDVQGNVITEAIEDEVVQLVLLGNSICNGQTISFEVWEKDLLLAELQPDPATFSGGKATTIWIAEYGEYYFITSSGGVTKTSGVLTVLPCTEDWSCTSWSACVSGGQTRTCTDLNSCGTDVSKPAETQSCTETCTGTPPAHSVLCTGDNIGLTADTPITFVDTCNGAKCEYVCEAGYVKSDNACVVACTENDKRCTDNILEVCTGRIWEIDTDCATEGKVCDDVTLTCVECTTSDDCTNPTKPVCGVEGTCLACTDSDGGKEYYIKGITFAKKYRGLDHGTLTLDEPRNFPDFCCYKDNCYRGPTETSNYLIERWCQEGIAHIAQYRCPNGCKDGACICIGNDECPSGYYCDDNGLCVIAALTYLCTGIYPVHSEVCPGDNIGLTADTPITFVDTCNGAKCEYVCEAGYVKSGDICAAEIVCTDSDGDDYGNPASIACTYPELDCDDTSDAIYPGAIEVCNGIDDDCDPATEDGSGETAPLNSKQDNICLDSTQSCTSGSWVDDYTTVADYEDPETTCDDTLDNDCDGYIDMDDSDCPLTPPPKCEICFRTSTEYCDIDHIMKPQKPIGDSCTNNCECETEICQDGICRSDDVSLLLNQTLDECISLEKPTKVEITRDIGLPLEEQCTLCNLITSFFGVIGKVELKLKVKKQAGVVTTEIEIKEGTLTAEQQSIWEMFQAQIEALVEAAEGDDIELEIEIEHELEEGLRIDIDADGIPDKYYDANGVLQDIKEAGEDCTENYECIDNLCSIGGICLNYEVLKTAVCTYADPSDLTGNQLALYRRFDCS